MAGRYVASESFEREVLQSERPTLVDFHADWCGPCRAVAPVLDELAHELEGQANVVTVNVDESADLVRVVASVFSTVPVWWYIAARIGFTTPQGRCRR